MTVEDVIPSQEETIRQEVTPVGAGPEMEEALERDLGAVLTDDPATKGAEHATDELKALQEALHGLDQALAAVDQAIRWTLEEAISNAAGFTRKTLVEVADDARASGSAFAETVSDQVEVTSSVLQKEAALLASTTSGVLRGIPDRLRGSQPPVVAEEPGHEAGEGEAQETQVDS